MEPAELCCTIIAWIEIVISGLIIGIVLLFTTMLISIPEELHRIVGEDPEQHREVQEFLELSDAAQAGFILLVLSFWTVIFVLALFLLHWTKKRYVRGLRIWLYCMAAITILSVPIDFIVIIRENFEISNIIIFVLGNLYAGFSIWAVWTYSRLIKSREGTEHHAAVEFQALT